MWTVKVIVWWALMHVLFWLQRALVWVLYVPMTALEALCDGREAVELQWLLACSERRLARRRRVNLEELSRVSLEDLEAACLKGVPHGERG